ncbi:MAG: tetratricopeptide repeat protein [Bacteroidetes bacterium]|nr:tetratricopeptide repeat protein [Bacteroidota bacterium]
MGNLYEGMGAYLKADTAYTHSLSILESILGLEHEYVGIVLVDKVDLYVKMGRYSSTDTLIKRVSQIAER